LFYDYSTKAGQLELFSKPNARDEMKAKLASGGKIFGPA
jgi:hypothetical protein